MKMFDKIRLMIAFGMLRLIAPRWATDIVSEALTANLKAARRALDEEISA